MKILGITVILTIIFLPPNLTSAQTAKDICGWDKARFGMTEEELKMVYQESIVEFPEAKRTQYWIMPKFGLKGLKIGEIDFNVRFFMDPKTLKLKWIQLTPSKKKGDGFEVSKYDYDKLKGMLISKYGPSTDEQIQPRQRSGVKEEYSASWNFQCTRIEGKYSVIGFSNFLSLFYRAIDQKGLDKL
jgi:hypothetical protein